MIPTSKSALKLFHEGFLALGEMEITGMPISMEKLDEADKAVAQDIREKETVLREHSVYASQRRLYGKNASINSREQLATILYDELKLPGAVRSQKTGKYKLDDETIALIDLDYIDAFRKLQRLYKLKNTYLDAFRREVVNGRIHTFFNLHTVTTFRSSSNQPNLQNIPIRNPYVGKIIRSLVRPQSDDYVILEADYATLEIVAGCCVHKDPYMRDHLLSGFDFHKVTARELFFLGEGVPKPLRQVGKGCNFALTYGDYYVSIATKAWKAIRTEKVGELTAYEHLAANGIDRLGTDKVDVGKGTFMGHVKKVTDRFWQERYPVYFDWRNTTWENYCKRGYLNTATGFCVHGILKRNEVYNVEIQGNSFHCLLNSVIQATREIKERGMRSRLICQIHDSILAEVHRDEVPEFASMIKDCMVRQTTERFPWITMPLGVEIEVGQPDWATKKLYEA